MQDLFVAATGQDRGKTSFCVGLLALLKEKIGDIGFMKPLGHRFVTTSGGIKIDEDVKLMKSIYGFKDDYRDLSPVIIDSGFTRHCIEVNCTADLEKKVMDSYRRIKSNCDCMVLEGSGKISVGEVLGVSNARIAELTGSRLVLVAEGGIGSTIDTVMLNMAFLDRFDIDVAGVVINKVFPDKVEEIWRTTAASLKSKGVDVLGVIPYDKMLSYPTLEHIINEVPDFKPLTEVSEEVQKTPINSIIIGAMTPHEALKYFKGRELIITGGDREDIIASALCQTAIQQQTKKGGNVLGIIATGGLKPHDSLLKTAENIGVMVMQAEEDTFTVASKVKDMTIKLRPKNVGKINKLKMIIKKYVNTDKLLNGL